MAVTAAELDEIERNARADLDIEGFRVLALIDELRARREADEGPPPLMNDTSYPGVKRD